MKTKIFLSMAVFMGLSFASCNDDDDYTIINEPMLTEDSVVTGSSDVTATTAVLHGTVTGLQNSAAASYAVGFKYGYSENALTESITGTYEDQTVTAEITGLTENTVLYYQAFVTLQGKVTFLGKVNSLVTTNTQLTTKSAEGVDYAFATMGGSATGAPADAKFGVVIAAKPEVEAVRGGLILPATAASSDFTVDYAGLAPNTTYYYASYADLGTGVVYGDVQTFTTSDFSLDLDNDLVDLGLSVKWAKFNLGARSESELGGRFGYGDLTGVSNSIDMADYGQKDIYRTDRDVANKAWSGSVTLPTAADFEELFNLCTKEWTVVDGVNGYKLTGPNGNSIFLPAAGSRTISEISGEGVNGVYATGSINPGNEQFAVAFNFSSSYSSRTSTPLYEALSVRPVSTARNVVFDKSLLYKTWEIDYNDGKCVKFNGPVWFYGTADSWRTVSNGEPIVGDSWKWDADASNTWAFGDCSGYMTLNADGTIVVKNQNGEEQTGTYTIDEANKTITSTVALLVPDNFPGQCANLKNEIKILSLTSDAAQFGYFRDGDPATLSVNMVPQLEKYGYTAKLTCYGGWNDNTWDSASITIPGGEKALGQHTITLNAAEPRPYGQVYVVDIEGFAAAYPNSFVRLDAIKADGKDVPFDGSKLFYGDIENKGTYRIELANIWGCGHNESWNGLGDSAFRPEGGEVTEETNLAFNSTFEVTFTIVSLDSNGAGMYMPKLATVAAGWAAQVWDATNSETFEVKYENFQYKLADNTTCNIKYEGEGYGAGVIMNFVQTDNLYQFFPGTKATLDKILIDGKELTGWDASKIVNTDADGAGVHHRVELWNCWGATSGNCAFGTATGDGKDIMAPLGFNSSIEETVTFKSLYANPWK
ncbi:MAG: hypothetical protein HFJ95_08730 [Muribaculaceae bacterium]|nr:hypothetical protein [Muribaculaceae bacterium]